MVLIRAFITLVLFVIAFVYFLFLFTIFGQTSGSGLESDRLRVVIQLPWLLAMLAVGIGWYLHVIYKESKNLKKYSIVIVIMSIVSVFGVWLILQRPAHNAFKACQNLDLSNPPTLEEFKEQYGPPQFINALEPGQKWEYENYRLERHSCWLEANPDGRIMKVTYQ